MLFFVCFLNGRIKIANPALKSEERKERRPPDGSVQIRKSYPELLVVNVNMFFSSALGGKTETHNGKFSRWVAAGIIRQWWVAGGLSRGWAFQSWHTLNHTDVQSRRKITTTGSIISFQGLVSSGKSTTWYDHSERFDGLRQLVWGWENAGMPSKRAKQWRTSKPGLVSLVFVYLFGLFY